MINPDPLGPARRDAEHLQCMLQQAREGDAAVLPELRRVLDHGPEIWQQASDLARQLESKILKLFAGKDLVLAESLKRRLDALRTELVGDADSPLERQLAERVVTCWLYSAYLDQLAVQSTAEFAPESKAVQKCHDSAQRQYLAALRTLAAVQSRSSLPSKNAKRPRKRSTAPPAVNSSTAPPRIDNAESTSPARRSARVRRSSERCNNQSKGQSAQCSAEAQP